MMKKLGISLACLAMIGTLLWGVSEEKKVLKETELDDFVTDSTNESAGIKRYALESVAEPTEISTSKIFAQYAFHSSENKYYLRFATAVKGNIKSITYTRGDQSFPVDIVYAGISANGTDYYYSPEAGLTTEETYKGEYYWACYSIRFNSNAKAFDTLDVGLSICSFEGEEFQSSRSVSLADVVSSDGYLMRNEIRILEAEDADEITGKISDSASASGGKFLESITGSTKFEGVNMDSSGMYNLNVAATWKSGSANDISSKAYSVNVNGENIGSYDVYNRSNWTGNFYETEIGPIALNEADNSIEIVRNGSYNLDYLSLTSYLKMESETPSLKEHVFRVNSFDYTATGMAIATASTGAEYAVEVNGNPYGNYKSREGDLSMGSILLHPGINEIRIEITEGECDLNYVSLTAMKSRGTLTSDGELTLEAENADYDGVTEAVAKNNPSQVFVKKIENHTTFIFDSEIQGTIDMTAIYAAYNALNDAFEFLVNNEYLSTRSLAAGNAWDRYLQVSEIAAVEVHKGMNVIDLHVLNSNFNLDCLTLSAAKSFNPSEPNIFEAERSYYAAGRLGTNTERNFIESISGDIVFHVYTSEDVQAELVIATANGSNETSNAYTLTVNGTDLGGFTSEKTGSWSAFEEFSLGEISLKSGRNVITIGKGSGNYNVDYILLNPVVK